MYGLQCVLALAHTEQKAIKGSKITSVQPFYRENQRSNLYKKRETRNKYKFIYINTRQLLYISNPFIIFN